MKIVRTSVVVASMACALVWSVDSRAQDDTVKKDTSGAAGKDAKTTKAGTTKKDTTGAKGTTGSSSDTSATGATGASGTSGSGSTTSGTTTTGTPDTMSGTGQTTGTTGTTGTGTTGTGTTGSMGGTGTTGTSSDTWGTGTSGSIYDSPPSGTTYPLGSQPGTTTTTSTPYGTQQQQPGSVSQTTSTTQTTSAMYDPSVAADRDAGEYKIRPNRPMLITGSAIFLGTYAATAIQGAVSNLDADRNNLIPVAGPWINMGERPCTLNTDCSTGENVNNVLLIGSGVAQGAGVAIAIASLFVPETKERSSMTAKEAPKGQFRVMPVQMGKGGAGFGAMGTF